jgi:FSR family fosmidomycin resistance protein-like MFS transporter
MSKKKHYSSVMVAFMLAHAANDGFSALFPPLLPLIREHFNLSYAKLGGIMTSYTFFGSLLQIPVGYLAYLIPSPTLMVTGLMWVSCGLLLATFAQSYWTLAAAFSLAGMGSATYHPLSFSLLSKFYKREILGRIVGLHMGASSAAHVITPLLVILLADRWGWFWPIRLWSFYGILAAILLLVVLRRHIDPEPKGVGRALKLPYFSSTLILFVVFRLSWSFAWRGMSVFLPIFLVEIAQFSIKFATLYFMGMYMVEVFARPLVGAYSDKIGNRKWVIMAECLLCAGLLVSLTVIKGKLLLLFIIFGIGFLAGSIPVVGQAYVIDMIPDEQRDRTLGFLFTIFNIAGTFSPLFIGLIADSFGLIQSFLVLTALVVASLIFLGFCKNQ